MADESKKQYWFYNQKIVLGAFAAFTHYHLPAGSLSVGQHHAHTALTQRGPCSHCSLPWIFSFADSWVWGCLVLWRVTTSTGHPKGSYLCFCFQPDMIRVVSLGLYLLSPLYIHFSFSTAILHLRVQQQKPKTQSYSV